MKMTLKEIHDTCNSWTNFCLFKQIDPQLIHHNSKYIEINLSLIDAQTFGIVKIKNIQNHSKPCVKCKQPVGFWTEICNFCDTNQLKILR